jgi:hypothetical protein
MQTSVQRRAVRRAIRTECQAVALSEFRLLGRQLLDVSPQGLLVRCEYPARLGDDIVVSFRPPGADAPWLEAEAIVARLVHGYRANDRGVCAGLSFTYIEKATRNELVARLAGYPPPIPQRRLRTARDRMTGSRRDAVVVHRIVTVQSEPVFPLLRVRAKAPKGVFRDAAVSSYPRDAQVSIDGLQVWRS